MLGVGALAFGLWPRAAVAVAYGLVVWSFLVETLASVIGSNHWLLDTSLLLHIAPVPAADPNWPPRPGSAASASPPPLGAPPSTAGTCRAHERLVGDAPVRPAGKRRRRRHRRMMMSPISPAPRSPRSAARRLGLLCRGLVLIVEMSPTSAPEAKALSTCA